MKKTTYLLLSVLFLAIGINFGYAQEEPARGMTAEEYEIAKSIEVEDLDNDTYVKIGEGDYVIDRYEMKPPYFITGDSGIKKRLDIYKLIEREGMGDLGLIVFFTNTEEKETFNLVIPNMATTGDVWNMYFDDIHQHDREENDVALKMSYILSKEVAYLMQKSSGVDMSAMDQDNADYDFCFAPSAIVTMAEGSNKLISEVKVGDQVLTLVGKDLVSVKVEGIETHQKKNILLSEAILYPLQRVSASIGSEMLTNTPTSLIATPNHPIMTSEGKKSIENMTIGDIVTVFDAQTQEAVDYKVYLVKPTNSVEKVYNLQVEGESYLVNNVLVLEK